MFLTYCNTLGTPRIAQTCCEAFATDESQQTLSLLRNETDIVTSLIKLIGAGQISPEGVNLACRQSAFALFILCSPPISWLVRQSVWVPSMRALGQTLLKNGLISRLSDFVSSGGLHGAIFNAFLTMSSAGSLTLHVEEEFIGSIPLASLFDFKMTRSGFLTLPHQQLLD